MGRTKIQKPQPRIIRATGETSYGYRENQIDVRRAGSGAIQGLMSRMYFCRGRELLVALITKVRDKRKVKKESRASSQCRGESTCRIIFGPKPE